jgi:phosphatidylserine decarboxylase
MTVHKEGFATLAVLFILLLFLNLLGIVLIPGYSWIHGGLAFLSLLFFLMVAAFFRRPSRRVSSSPGMIYAPADGEIVSLEEVEDNEYFKGKRMQVSIFMSIYNIHMNLFPADGKVIYHKYHPGKHLVAFHPKSSSLNEHTTVVIRTDDEREIMVRQIAGGIARRIVCYACNDQSVKQGDELGFIKFGSRVDVLLPLEYKVKVHLNQKVKASVDLIAIL